MENYSWMVIEMDKNVLKSLIISVIIIAITLCVCLFFTNINTKKSEYDHLRNYEVNEYIPTYVSTEDLVKIYLNDYLYNMRYAVDKAYESLDLEYRNKRFGSLENYKNYVEQFKTKEISAKRYSRESKKGYSYYKIYDSDDNVYIFKTKGIMQYSIFLDEDTIEIR